jgi:hypothetical protein
MLPTAARCARDDSGSNNKKKQEKKEELINSTADAQTYQQLRPSVYRPPPSLHTRPPTTSIRRPSGLRRPVAFPTPHLLGVKCRGVRSGARRRDGRALAADRRYLF